VRHALIDTSVYIDLWTGALAPETLDPLRRGLVIRNSSVVLSELRRGARTRKAIRTVEALRRASHALWTPTDEDWWEAGGLVRRIGDERDWEIAKRREFQNDVLIALSARHHGALVITRNRADFELLGHRLGIVVVVL